VPDSAVGLMTWILAKDIQKVYCYMNFVSVPGSACWLNAVVFCCDILIASVMSLATGPGI
jgi:hypothetical protein